MEDHIEEGSAGCERGEGLEDEGDGGGARPRRGSGGRERVGMSESVEGMRIVGRARSVAEKGGGVEWRRGSMDSAGEGERVVEGRWGGREGDGVRGG
ncbi:hypothetical protein Tco_1319197 [Tanacetum coccineum]